MITRRDFLRYGAVGGAGLYLTLRGGGVVRMAYAQIPGGTLDPLEILKFQTPLLVPPAMPRARKLRVKGNKNIDYYEIAVRQFQQQILPAGMPPTTVWGYGPRVAMDGPQIFNAPSLTIEAKWNSPVRVKWINELRVDPANPASDFLPHLLPVDPTLHWANPPGGDMYRDTRPHFMETPGPYDGPVPMVTHVHGSAGVGDESDGYAEAWYLPKAGNIPAGYATKGTWYDFFAAKAAGKGYLAPGTSAWEPDTAVFQYPNSQRASTIWYHDHTLGMTRLNVYAGPAGFFIIRGGPEGDKAVLDVRTGMPAMLPGPAPAIGDAPGMTYYEIPVAIQDRAFDQDGSLFYPDTRAFFDGIVGPFIGGMHDGEMHEDSMGFSPIWNPEFFGNTIMVNGNTWPFQTVEQRRYRFRFLNGCQSRFLILDFSNIPGVEVWQIGNEGGFLAAPVNLTANHGGRLLMGLAERADLVVDFTNVPVGSYLLGNLGPDTPFRGGIPGVDFDPAHADTTGQVMELRVVPAMGIDTTTPPMFLTLPAIAPLPAETVTRPLALIEEMGMGYDALGNQVEGPSAAVLGIADGGIPTAKLWMDEVTENPAVGDTEVWEYFNTTGDAHPMHIHEVLFQVVNRQGLTLNPNTGALEADGTPIPPEPWENGWKDTVTAYPGQVTRVRMQFTQAGQYVWHCHIVEHEDNEMMRPYRIGPKQIGSPDPPPA